MINICRIRQTTKIVGFTSFITIVPILLLASLSQEDGLNLQHTKIEGRETLDIAKNNSQTTDHELDNEQNEVLVIVRSIQKEVQNNFDRSLNILNTSLTIMAIVLAVFGIFIAVIVGFNFYEMFRAKALRKKAEKVLADTEMLKGYLSNVKRNMEEMLNKWRDRVPVTTAEEDRS